MRSMNTLNKMKDKATKLAANVPPLYREMKRMALRHTTSLPEEAEALALLERASMRPRGGLCVPPRRWPEVPNVDVSIIVPCYNVAHYVEPCIRSVLAQATTRTFEVICIDDGSKDDTGAILDALAAGNASIHVIHQENKGLSGARNTGIEAARGKLLMFVDGDDMMLPGAIEAVCNAYDEGGCDFVTASYENLSEDGKTVTPLNAPRHHGAPWGRLYSREVWRNLEFPEGFWFEDTVQGLCIEPRWHGRYIDVPVYLYRSNSKGITNTAFRSKKGLDTLWIVDELLSWNQQLGVAVDDALHEKILMQLGPTLWVRTGALSESERIAMFAYACNVLEKYDGGNLHSTKRDARWSDLEIGLRTRNYQLWRIAVLGLLRQGS